MTPEFVKACSFDISLLSELDNGTLRVNGFGGLFSRPLGYIAIAVQVEGVLGYDKYQVVLIIPDPTEFGSWVPVTVGTQTIN